MWGQLISAETPDSVSAYAYNGEGLRVSKSVTENEETTETAYLYEYSKVVLELDENGDETAHNVYGNNTLISRTTGDGTLCYLYNGHGDVVQLADALGAIVMTYDYDAFGVVTTATGSISNSYLYSGYQYDGETGMYYLNARYYDPVVARFVSADSYLGEVNDPLSLNLYTYCSSNPLIYTDPTGHWQQGDEKLSQPQQDLIRAATAEWEAAAAIGNKTAMDAANKAAIAVRNGANAALIDLAGASGASNVSFDAKSRTASVTVNGITQSFKIDNGTDGTYAVINGHIILNNEDFDNQFSGQIGLSPYSSSVNTKVTAESVSSAVTTKQYGLPMVTVEGSVANSFHKSTSDVNGNSGTNNGSNGANAGGAIVDAYINNLINDTSLGLSETKKETMIVMASTLLNEGFEPAFVAGILANILSEGTAGSFESSAYRDSDQEPAYLKYMDENYSYRSDFSGKNISEVGVAKTLEVLRELEAGGYQGKFGLGCVQWTGSRTMGLVECYIAVCGKEGYPTKEQCYQAESLYIAQELLGRYNYVYQNWLSSNSDVNTEFAAESAGEIVCKQYEVPYQYSQKAITRGADAISIFNVMVGK
ncbi:hypothetical protein SDC9_83354 [bioreactor metagenome]|uniref:Phage tail lysozyme domain-containing protein n=1 Tax=bioreactor metagenome TaxID=1076179 RepID=A0A644Z7G2_9ZZZZ